MLQVKKTKRNKKSWLFDRTLQMSLKVPIQLSKLYVCETEKALEKAVMKKKCIALKHSMNSPCKLLAFVNIVDIQSLSLSLPICL